jgi:hypothetical protein
MPSNNKLPLEALRRPGPAADRKVERVVEDLEKLVEEAKRQVAQNVATAEATQEQMREFWRIDIDLHKHLTTLSTASIVGVAALLKVSPFEPRLDGQIVVSFVLLVMTIILSVLAMTSAQLRLLDMPSRPRREDLDPPRSWLKRKVFALFYGLHWVCRAASFSTFASALALIANATLQNS